MLTLILMLMLILVILEVLTAIRTRREHRYSDTHSVDFGSVFCFNLGHGYCLDGEFG